MIGLWFDAHGLSKECIVTVNATRMPERSSCNAIINNYKSNKNSYLITVQSDKYQTTKSFFALNGFREKHILSHSMYSERCHYVTSNDQLILIKHTIFIVFNKIKPAVHQVRFLNNLMIGVCILCEEGFQESSAINEKIQQHNSGLITHWTKSSV